MNYDHHRTVGISPSVLACSTQPDFDISRSLGLDLHAAHLKKTAGGSLPEEDFLPGMRLHVQAVISTAKQLSGYPAAIKRCCMCGCSHTFLVPFKTRKANLGLPFIGVSVIDGIVEGAGAPTVHQLGVNLIQRGKITRNFAFSIILSFFYTIGLYCASEGRRKIFYFSLWLEVC